MLPLEGTTVVELGHYIAGPFATQMLADYGARVIKIEPKGGESARSVFPVRNGRSAYYAALNRGKESITLDLRDNEDLALFKEIIKTADALVSNYRSGVLDALGLSTSALHALNSGLVYVPITGYGLEGPYSSRPAFDGAIQAASGLMHVTGEEDSDPLRAGLFIPDHVSAMNAAFAVLLGIQGRRLTGRGGTYEISMLDVMASMHAYNFSLVSDIGASPIRKGNASSNTFSDVFPAKDGFVYIAAVSDKMWKNLTCAIGEPELSDRETGFPTVDDRLKHYDALVAKVANWTARLSLLEIEECLLEHSVPFAPIATVEQVLSNPQLVYREKFKTVEYGSEALTVFDRIIPMPSPSSRRVEDIGESTQRIKDEFETKMLSEDAVGNV